MLTSILIALMIAFGFISSESEYHQLDQAQKDHYEEIIIDETVDF